MEGHLLEWPAANTHLKAHNHPAQAPGSHASRKPLGRGILNSNATTSEKRWFVTETMAQLEPWQQTTRVGPTVVTSTGVLIEATPDLGVTECLFQPEMVSEMYCIFGALGGGFLL